MSEKQTIEYIDNMNKKEFQYIGVRHFRSGYRLMVEATNNFLEQLQAKPHEEIKIVNPQSKNYEFQKYAITITIPSYVNIYKYVDVRNKLGKLSKEKCIAKLEY